MKADTYFSHRAHRFLWNILENSYRRWNRSEMWFVEITLGTKYRLKQRRPFLPTANQKKDCGSGWGGGWEIQFTWSQQTETLPGFLKPPCLIRNATKEDSFRQSTIKLAQYYYQSFIHYLKQCTLCFRTFLILSLTTVAQSSSLLFIL